MKAFLATWSLMAVFMILLAGLASAKDIPSGSYRQTCRDIRINDNGLYATCQKADGSWKKTSLSSAGFPCDEIENDDGQLVCIGGN